MSIRNALILISIIAVHSSAGVWNWVADDFDVLMRTHGELSFFPTISFPKTTRTAWGPRVLKSFFKGSHG